jgi:hypothetical protein
MQRLNAASSLLLTSLALATCPVRAERVTLEVVRTHTGVRLGDASTAAAPPAKTTRCDGTTGGYSREFGFSCLNVADLLEHVSVQEGPDYRFFYDVRVILPDEARLLLHCSTILNAQCEALPAYLERTSVTCSDFVAAGARYKDCTAYPTESDRIGVYQAALHGDTVTIYGADWQRDYVLYGTWNPADPAAQNPPAPSQEAKPAAPPQAPAAEGEIIDPQIISDARAGDAIAQYKLGYDYYLGQGISQDYVQAAIWWRKAAEQGYADAQNNLGVLYNSGKGVPQSYAEAYFWQNLAAARANGRLQAQFAKNRDDSAAKLSFFERLRVQKRASRWFSEHPVANTKASEGKTDTAKPAETKPTETAPVQSTPPKSDETKPTETAPAKPDEAKPESKPDSTQPQS